MGKSHSWRHNRGRSPRVNFNTGLDTPRTLCISNSQHDTSRGERIWCGCSVGLKDARVCHVLVYCQDTFKRKVSQWW